MMSRINVEDNRRKYQRTDLSCSIDYSSNNKAQARNISEGGICIETKHKVSESTLLFLIISLMEKGVIQVIGRVVWSHKLEDNRFENGLEFFCLSDFNKNKIKNYVDCIKN